MPSNANFLLYLFNRQVFKEETNRKKHIVLCEEYIFPVGLKEMEANNPNKCKVYNIYFALNASI